MYAHVIILFIQSEQTLNYFLIWWNGFIGSWLRIADFPSSGFEWLLTLRHNFAWNAVSGGYCFFQAPWDQDGFSIAQYMYIHFIMLPYHHRRIHCIISIQFVYPPILSSADTLYIFAFFQMLLNGHDKYAKSYLRLMLFSGCNFEGKFLYFPFKRG